MHRDEELVNNKEISNYMFPPQYVISQLLFEVVTEAEKKSLSWTFDDINKSIFGVYCVCRVALALQKNSVYVYYLTC